MKKIFMILIILNFLCLKNNTKLDCLFKGYLKEKFNYLYLNNKTDNFYLILKSFLKKNKTSNKVNFENKERNLNVINSNKNIMNIVKEIPFEFKSKNDNLYNFCLNTLKEFNCNKYLKYYFCKKIIISTPNDILNNFYYFKGEIKTIIFDIFKKNLNLPNFNKNNEFKNKNELEESINNFMKNVDILNDKSIKSYLNLIKNIQKDNENLKILENNLNVNKNQVQFIFNYFKEIINKGYIKNIIKFMNINLIKYKNIKEENIISKDFIFINKITKINLNYDLLNFENLVNFNQVKMLCILYLNLDKNNNLYFCNKDLLVIKIDKNFIKFNSDLFYLLLKSDSFKADIKVFFNNFINENKKTDNYNLLNLLNDNFNEFISNIKKNIKNLLLKTVGYNIYKLYSLFYELIKIVNPNDINTNIKNIILSELNQYLYEINNIYEFSNEINNLKNKIIYKINKNIHMINFSDFKVNLAIKKLLDKCQNITNLKKLNLCKNVFKKINLKYIKDYYSYNIIFNFIFSVYLKIIKNYKNENKIINILDLNIKNLFKINYYNNIIENKKFLRLINFIINAKLQYQDFQSNSVLDISRFLIKKRPFINIKHINSKNNRLIILELYTNLKNYNNINYSNNTLNTYKTILFKKYFYKLNIIKDLYKEFKNNLNFLFLHFDNLSSNFQNNILKCNLNLDNKFKKCEKIYGVNNCKKNSYIVKKKCPFGTILENKILCVSLCPKYFIYEELFCKKPSVYELNINKFLLKKDLNCKDNFYRIGIFCIPKCPSNNIDYGSHCKRIIKDNIKYFIWEPKDN